MAALLVGLVIGLGGLLVTALFTPKPKDTYGSRLSDINVTAVSPGNIIPRVWGTMKVNCQLIFASPLIETMHTHQASKKGGGKGSLFGGAAKNYTFTYSLDVAFAICGGPVYQVQRIYANQKLLWVNPAQLQYAQADFDAAYQSEATRLIDQEGVQLDYAASSAFVFAFNNFDTGEVTLSSPSDAVAYITSHPIDDTAGITGMILTPDGPGVTSVISQLYSGLNNQEQYLSQVNRFDNLEIYQGDELQIPNGLLQGYLGSGNAPAFRGCCYFVLTNLQLMDFGNSLPAFSAVVQFSPSGTTSLPEIISDVLFESGLEQDQFDCISNVDATPFPGFSVTANTSARQILQDLQKAFPIDCAETGGLLLFSMVNRSASVILDRADFGAHIDTEALPTSEEVTIVSDYDLPYRMNFSYQEPARNYSKNTVYFQRTNTPSTSVEDVDVTVGLDRSTAQTAVTQMIVNRLFSRRMYKVMLPRKYIQLDATDVIRVLTAGQNLNETDYYEEMYCTETQVGANGIIEATFIDHFYMDPNFNPKQQVGVDNAAVISTAGVALAAALAVLQAAQQAYSVAEAAYTTNPTLGNQATLAAALATQNAAQEAYDIAVKNANPSLPTTSQTMAFLFDCPLLSDSDPDKPGFYVLLSGAFNGWQGGGLYVDTAEQSIATAYGLSSTTTAAGSNWQQIAASQTNVPWGTALDALKPGITAGYWDRESVIHVFINNGMELQSAAETDMLTQLLNVTFIGGELVMYANATDLGNGLWRLANFLRGLRNTEYLMDNHTSNENFVRLSPSLARVTTTVGDLNIANTMVGISASAATESQPSFSFTDTGNSCRPPTVYVYRKFRNVDGDIEVDWYPRARQGGTWTSGTDITIEANDLPETYSVDVLTAPGGTVVNTYSVTGDLGGAFVYTSAQQTTDFGSPQAHIYLAIYQISQVVGRGFGKGITI
jgi:hypothetical protein